MRDVTIDGLFLGYRNRMGWFPVYRIDAVRPKLLPTVIFAHYLKDNPKLKEQVTKQLGKLLELEEEDLLIAIAKEYLNCQYSHAELGLDDSASWLDYLARTNGKIGENFDIFPQVALDPNNHFCYFHWLLEPFSSEPEVVEKISKDKVEQEFMVKYDGVSCDIFHYPVKISEAPDYINFMLQHFLYYRPEAKVVKVNDNFPLDRCLLVEFSCKFDRPYNEPLFETTNA